MINSFAPAFKILTLAEYPEGVVSKTPPSDTVGLTISKLSEAVATFARPALFQEFPMNVTV